MSRREKIEQMLVEDPADVFLRYSLALELEKEGQHEQSLDGFRQLQAETPPYVPAFFMAGQQLARLERNDEARQVLRDGVRQAEAQGNAHAAGEMAEFLASLDALD